MKCSVYIAASVDGFIADKNGGIEWLNNPEYGTEFNGITYSEFILNVDTLLMGRKTFEKVMSFNEWPYNGIEVVVLTNREIHIPENIREKIIIKSGKPEEIINELKKQGRKHLYIDGGETIRKFIEANLIDEIIVTVIPILLGEGVPLFAGIKNKVNLLLNKTYTSSNGFVQLHYNTHKEKIESKLNEKILDGV